MNAVFLNSSRRYLCEKLFKEYNISQHFLESFILTNVEREVLHNVESNYSINE